MSLKRNFGFASPELAQGGPKYQTNRDSKVILPILSPKIISNQSIAFGTDGLASKASGFGEHGN